jgi:hypothetical protein
VGLGTEYPPCIFSAARRLVTIPMLYSHLAGCGSASHASAVLHYCGPASHPLTCVEVSMPGSPITGLVLAAQPRIPITLDLLVLAPGTYAPITSLVPGV